MPFCLRVWIFVTLFLVVCADGEFDVDNCIAPAEYRACRDAAAGLEDCSKPNRNSLIQCKFPSYVAAVNCFGSYCWNNPTPENAPGECSCNIGKALNPTYELSYNVKEPCSMEHGIRDGKGRELEEACTCCRLSLTYSLLVDTCPTTYTPLIDFGRNDSLSQMRKDAWNKCSDVLPKYNCRRDMGYEFPSNIPVYQPSNLPKVGTESITTKSGEVTSPMSGWTYTWSILSETYTVTAFGQKAVSTSASEAVTSTAEVTGIGQAEDTGSSAGSGSSSPTPTSSGRRLSHQINRLYLAISLLIGAIIL